METLPNCHAGGVPLGSHPETSAESPSPSDASLYLEAVEGTTHAQVKALDVLSHDPQECCMNVTDKPRPRRVYQYYQELLSVY